MIVEDRDLAIKKFKMYAEKVDNETQIIDLCKKYLKHKSIDVDSGFAEHFKPKIPERIYVGMTDIIPVRGEIKIDDMALQQSTQEMMYAKKYVIDQITHQIVRDDMITFQSFKKIDTYQTIIQGKLNVYKEPRK